MKPILPPQTSCNRWQAAVLTAIAAIYTAAFSWISPLATNDGPIHMSFANFFVGAGTQPALENYYEANPRFNPNSLIYYLLRSLLEVMPPHLAESLLQLGYLLGSVGAVYFVCKQVNAYNAASSAAITAVLAFPLALNQMFFLGLYNYSYSAVFFLAFLGYFLRLQNLPSWPTAIAAVVSLLLTLLAHASGFIAADIAIAVLIAMQIVPKLLGGRRLKDVLVEHRIELVVSAFAFLLLCAMFLKSARSTVEFGPGVYERVRYILTAQGLYLNHARGNGAVAVTIGIALSAAPLLAWRFTRKGRRTSFAASSMTARALALWCAMFALALLFPDVMGGGWTHFRRMAIFPLYMSLICYASLPLSAKWQGAMAAFGAATGLALLALMCISQRQTRLEAQELSEIDRRIGAHCTVLPLVTEPFPHDEVGQQRELGYSPFFQVASYLELNKDRPVLFNFLARLNVYPVRFKKGKDVQELLFHWTAEQKETNITIVDIPRFEGATGMHVDYILQWGNLDSAKSTLRSQIVAAEAGAAVVYESAKYHIRLFQRRPGAVSSPASRCDFQDGHGAAAAAVRPTPPPTS